MPKKTPPSDSATQEHRFSEQVKDSAHQIWLAGLAAFAKAQQEGSKVFDAMVKEGAAVQSKAQAVAEHKWHEATEKLTHLASDAGSRAGGQWDKIENIFEDRVARALQRLGVPTTTELARLQAQLEDLRQTVQSLAGEGKMPPRSRTAKKRPARKSSARAST